MDANSNNGAQKYQKSYFDVVGLCCSSEVPLIEKILKPLEGVKEISVIVPSRTVIVLHDDLLTSQSDIVRVLNGARMEANVRVYGKTKLKRKWPNKFAIGCGVLWLISLFKFFYHPLRWVALAAVALGISPIALRGAAAIRNFRLDINILMLIAVIGTIALKDYLEAATIVFLFSIAEWLESMASHKATTVMSSLMSIAPQKATIAETGEVIPINDVKVNTVLAVKAGEIIPVDGVVVEGNCEVDEKTLTGESFPVAKETDSTVWAGTINLNGYVSVRTTALAEDCVVSRMAKLVEEAQNRKSRTQRLIDTCAIYYTPAVVVISAGLAAIPAAMRIHDQNRWFHIALVVLVSACPCSLILSTPVATFCALSKAATTGLLIKGGDYLETLSKIKMVAFDKTGTLTKGQFVVTDFRSLSEDVNLSTLIYWVSSIESKSSHPMAEALLDYGWSRSVEPRPESVEEFENFPGEGVYGKIDGTDIHIGNKKIGIRAGCGTVQNLETEPKGGSTIGNIYVNGTHVGLFGLSDSCRSGVAEAIKDLKSLSIRTSMLTGDNHGAARQIQHQSGYGLDEVHAELLPEDKARIIKDFQKGGRTAMVGDGLNDAIALAAADIGISMGISGSALATDTGHVILMSNDIRKIPKAVKLARKCQRKVIENIVLSFVTKAAVLALACAGHPLVSVAVIADVGTCLLVIFNSSTLLMGGQRARRKHSTHNHHHHHAHGCNDLSTADGKTETRCENRGCSSKICGSQCQPSPSISTSCRRKKCSQKQPDCGEANTLHCGHNGDSHQTVCAHRPESTDHGHFQCKGQAANSGDIHQTTCGDHRPRREEGHSRCITENPGNFDRTTCEHRPERTENGKFQCKGHGQTSRSFDQIGCDHRRESTDHGHSGCKLENGVDDAGLGAVLHACMSLEKREMGGCCKNFREECCGKHGNHIEGGLTEIITE